MSQTPPPLPANSNNSQNNPPPPTPENLLYCNWYFQLNTTKPIFPNFYAIYKHVMVNYKDSYRTTSKNKRILFA